MTSLDEHVGATDAERGTVCSAKACRASAVWLIHWRNPRIHGLQRRKAWTACEAHQESLAEFLRVRSFLLDVIPLP